VTSPCAYHERMRCSKVGHQVAALIARLVEGRERQLRLARENGALSERLIGLEHELRRLRGTPASDEFVPEPTSAPEPEPEAEHPGRSWCASDPPNAPSGCAPGLLPPSLPTADADTPGDGAPSAAAIPAARALVGPVLMPLMYGPVAPRWPGERRADELREQSEEVTLLHGRPKTDFPHGLWVVVMSQVSAGRRRRPAASPPKALVDGPQDTTAWSGAEVLVAAFSLIVSITVCSLMALWWVLR
jgi:hypothetical protein